VQTLRDSISSIDQRLEKLGEQVISLKSATEKQQADHEESAKLARDRFEAIEQKLLDQDAALDALHHDATLARTTEARMKELMKITTALAQRIVLHDEKINRQTFNPPGSER
jgi:hypothetical protein